MSLPHLTLPRAGFRQVVSLCVLGLFAWAYWRDPANPGFASTVQNAVVGVLGYWIGSSQGAQENRETLNRLHTRPPGQETSP